MVQPIVSLPTPLPHQTDILLSDARFKLIAAGRRMGKTATGLMAVLLGHGSTRGTFKGAIDGGRIWWVAPSYPTIESSKIWHDLKRATQDAWIDKSEIDRRIELPGGGTVSVRSADNPDSLRGPGLDGLVIDEAAFLKVDAWLHALRPALSDRQGWAMLLSSPNGHNWFYDLFNECVEWDDWQRWKHPSSVSPLVTDDELTKLKRLLGPRRFAQEHMAEFTAMQGALFPAEYFEDHIWTDRWPDAFDLSVITLDPSLGRTLASDYSAIVFAGLNGGRWYIDADIERRPPTQIVEDVIRIFATYHPNVVGIESDGFQAVLHPLFDQYCQLHNVPPLPIALIQNGPIGSKNARVACLDPYLANRQLAFPRTDGNRMMMDQLRAFPLKGHHDDGPDALEMAMRLAQEFHRIEAEQAVEQPQRVYA